VSKIEVRCGANEEGIPKFDGAGPNDSHSANPDRDDNPACGSGVSANRGRLASGDHR